MIMCKTVYLISMQSSIKNEYGSPIWLPMWVQTSEKAAKMDCDGRRDMKYEEITLC